MRPRPFQLHGNVSLGWLQTFLCMYLAGRQEGSGASRCGRRQAHAQRREAAGHLCAPSSPGCPPPPGCWRFVGSWVVYSAVTGYYLYRCSARQLDKSLPKQVPCCRTLMFSALRALAFFASSLANSSLLIRSIPGQVYAWFMVVFRVSVGVGFVGYVMLILEFTGLGLLFRAVLGPGAALTGACVAAPRSAGRGVMLAGVDSSLPLGRQRLGHE